METSELVVQETGLVDLGKRQLSVRGWRHLGAEAHLRWHQTKPGAERWCSIECMARSMFGRNTPANRAGVGQRMARLFQYLLARKAFLVIDYTGAGGRIRRCRLFSGADEEERGIVLHQIERMRRRGELSHERFEIARALLGGTV